MPRDQFNVDEAEDFDDGTRAVSYASGSGSEGDAGSDNENARLTSSRRLRLAAGRSRGAAAERASALRVKNWDDGAPEGKVIKRSELGMQEQEEAVDSPDEDAMADWSDAEPFGASDDESEAEAGQQQQEEEEEEEEDDEDEDEDDNEEDAEQLIRGFEKEDAAQLMSAKDREKVVEKAQHVRHQKVIWERCLEVQIYTKRLLMATKAAAAEQATDKAKRQVLDQLYACIDTVSGVQAKLCNSPELAPPSTASAKKRKRSCDELWTDLMDENAAALPQYNGILNTYSRKTDLAAGARSGSQAKKFRAVNQDILAQVESVLVDPQRVKRKAHAPADRGEAGSSTSNEEDAAEDALDELMYDDSDFYQQLLKEFIESGGGAQDAPLQRAHRKKKKVVNRKASKGRQLRFNVHPKLENFMFPEPYPKPEIDVDELFRSLFDQLRQ